MHSTGTLSSNDLQSLEWRLNGCDGVSNHQPPHCLLLDLVSCGLKKTSNHRGPVNSPHKWPVTRKMFPFDDVIMVTWQWCADARGVSQQWLPGDMSHCPPPPKKNKKKQKTNNPPPPPPPRCNDCTVDELHDRTTIQAALFENGRYGPRSRQNCRWPGLTELSHGYTYCSTTINSLTVGRCNSNFESAIFRRMLRIKMIMTSSNGDIFRVTGPLCGEFTDHRWIPLTRPVRRSFDVFYLRLNKRFSKQTILRDLRSHGAHYDATVMIALYRTFLIID